MIVLTGLVSAALLVIALVAPSSPVLDRILRGWSVTGLRLAGIRLEVRGAEHISRSQAYVFVANHISVIDIFAHYSALPVPTRFLAKRELFRIPVFGQAMRAIGIVEVDRAGGPEAMQRIRESARRVTERGLSLIVYPEGTRSRDGELQRFKMGAFAIAANMSLPIVPTTIQGTREVMRAGSHWIRGGPVTLVIDEPIHPRGTGRAEIVRLAKASRAIIEARYEELRSERSVAAQS